MRDSNLLLCDNGVVYSIKISIFTVRDCLREKVSPRNIASTITYSIAPRDDLRTKNTYVEFDTCKE